MMTSRTRPARIPPTRLMAAWIILVGIVGGLGMAALLLPPFEHRENQFSVDLPPTPDRYASAVTDGANRAPKLHVPEKSGIVSDPQQNTSAPETMPELVLTPVADAPLPLPLSPETPGGDEVVITVPAVASATGKGGQRVAPRGPDPTLMAKTPSGTRPAIASDGRTPFSAYRRKDVRLASAPTRAMAIMVSGLGLDPELTERAIDQLPPEVSLSFAPYSSDLERYIERATAKGHEVAIEIPMEQAGIGVDALGTAALLTTHTDEANEKRLDWMLSRARAYPMVTNYLGQTFSQDDRALRAMLSVLDGAGLAYIDDTGLAAGAAIAMGVPYAPVQSLVPPGTSDVATRITKAAEKAGSTPRVVKVYASAGGLEGVLDWAQSDPRKTVTLVPVSAAAK